jgi:hypothetical protein
MRHGSHVPVSVPSDPTPSMSKTLVATKPAHVRRASPCGVSRTPTVSSVCAVTPAKTSRRAASTSKAP